MPKKKQNQQARLCRPTYQQLLKDVNVGNVRRIIVASGKRFSCPQRNKPIPKWVEIMHKK